MKFVPTVMTGIVILGIFWILFQASRNKSKD